MKAWMIPCVALLAGFGLGICIAPSPGSARRQAPSAESSASRAAASWKSKTPPLDMPAPSAADFEERIGRLCEDLKGAGKDELLARLQQVTDDRTLLPALADFYEKELLGRLVDLGAARDAIEFGDARQREESVRIVVGQLALRDAKAAEALMDELPSTEQKVLAGKALLEAMGKTHPDHGLALLRSRPELRPNGYTFFEAWAKKEPRKAAEAALDLQKEVGASFVHSAVYQWAQDDPEQALKWVENLPADMRYAGQSAYMNALVNKDPELALKTILAKPELGSSFGDWIGRRLADDRKSADALLDRVPPGDLRRTLVGGIAENLLRNDPAEAVAWANTLLPGEQDAAIQSMFRSLSYEDPAGAMKFAAGQLKGPAAERAIASIAGEWMNSDFEGAFTAITTQLHGDALKHVLANPSMWEGSYSLIGKDPGPRLELVSRLEPEMRRDALQAMGVQWGMVDPQAMRAHLDGLAPDDRSAVVEGLIRGMGSDHPGLPAEFAKLLPPDRQLANAESIARAIASTDPAGAAGFLLGLPGDYSTRAPAMGQLVDQWSVEDPAAAVNFVAVLPLGDAKDQVALKLAGQLRKFDPDGATAQLAGISGDGARAGLIRDLAGMWKRVDPARGRTLLLAAARSDGERKSILATLGER